MNIKSLRIRGYFYNEMRYYKSTFYLLYLLKKKGRLSRFLIADTCSGAAISGRPEPTFSPRKNDEIVERQTTSFFVIFT